jgi:hypothetical protein
MKKKTILNSIALFAMLAVNLAASAQTTDPVLGASGGTANHTIDLKVDGSALLAIRNTSTGATSTGIKMSLTGATQAGAAVLSTISDNNTRLRISSLVESGKKRSISVAIAPALTGTGTELYVKLETQNTFLPAVDNAGTPSEELNLTAGGNAQTVVSDITTCWSGLGDTDGYIVTYRYAKATGATALKSETVTVTYTISGEA